MNKKGLIILSSVVLTLLLVVVLARKNILQEQKKKRLIASSESRPKQASLPKEIGREFSFEINNKEKVKIRYSLESAETLSEITVKGEKVKALGGRAFLIFNLKIINGGKQGIKINSRDFVRLALSGKEEWLAPEIHNDPVEVQAISTKYTRVGFSIGVGEKKFRVKLGEIGGEKIDFDLVF